MTSRVAHYINNPALDSVPLTAKLQTALNNLPSELKDPRHYFRLESEAANILEEKLSEIKSSDSLREAFTYLINRPKCVKVLLTHPLLTRLEVSEEIINSALADLAVSSSDSKQVEKSFKLLIKKASNPDYASLLSEALKGHNPPARDRKPFILLCLKHMGEKNISIIRHAALPKFVNDVENIIKTLKPLPPQPVLAHLIKEASKQITSGVSQRSTRDAGQIKEMVDDIMDISLGKESATLSNLCRTASERETMKKELTKFLTTEGARKFCLSDKTRKNIAEVAKYSAIVAGIAVATAAIGFASGVLAVPSALAGSALALSAVSGVTTAKTISAVCAISVPAVVGVIKLDKRQRYDISRSAADIAKTVISPSTEIKTTSRTIQR